MPRDLVGDVLYHVVAFGVRLKLQLHRGSELPMTQSKPDLEPQWRWCHDCARETVWDGYRWVMEGCESYECSHCGAVS